MKLKEIYSSNNNKPIISYEVFPPKDDLNGEKTGKLFEELEKLAAYKPSLISVTYGAGGSNRNESVEIIRRIKNDFNITPMPHFTCVSTDEKNINDYLKTIAALDVENILALRGDIPLNGDICHDFAHADDLISYIKSHTNLSVAAAGYPEGHKEADSLDEDIFFLKQKVLKGAEIIYTQMFFNNDHYFSFVERCLNNGITVPIIPGILPVTSFKQLHKMSQMCKVEIPEKLAVNLEKFQDDKDYVKKCGIEFASLQCKELIENGVKGLHFYTLNKSYAVGEILSNLLLIKD